MIPESLLVDIQTILNIIRFNVEFRGMFLKIHFISNEIASAIAQYTDEVNIESKNKIWDFCSTLEHIIEINKTIKEWRKITPNYKEIEEDLYLIHEKSYSYDIIGRIVKTQDTSENSKALVNELLNNKFYFNGMSVIVSRAINNTINTTRSCRLHFFY